MELIIVPDDGLVRAGGRLAAALGLAHEALMLAQQEFRVSAAPGPRVGVIFMGDRVGERFAGTGRHEEHGVAWGVRGHEAWISARSVADPQATLDQMGLRIADLQSEARAALAPLGPLPDPRQLHGIHLAGSYLDPKLRVPAQTVAGGQFSFTPERMCWERQYTLGIVHFLAKGFDGWAAQIVG